MGPKKRQDLPAARPATLAIVATPVGNLSDLSPRALEVLREAEEVFCEDTRRTLQLLNHFGISSTVRRFDQHASEAEARRIAERARETGARIAYVSDAGTPGVSDPGAALVRAAVAAGIAVSPIPGPCAWIALHSASGWEGGALAFRGFFPRLRADREAEAAWLRERAEDGAYYYFESPQRIAETAAFLAEAFPDEAAGAAGVLGKELTKVHEWIGHGGWPLLSSHIQNAADPEFARGEWVFGVRVERAKAARARGADGELDGSISLARAVDAVIDLLLEEKTASSQIARKISQYFGVGKNRIYSRVLEKTVRAGTDPSDGADGK